MGSIAFTNASNTSILSGNFQIPSTAGATVVNYTSTFALDVTNPFHRIFAAVMSSTSNPNAYMSTFSFSNAGSVISSQSIAWGLDSVINASSTGINILPFLGYDNLNIHSSWAGVCSLIGIGVGDSGLNGFISQWSGLATSLSIQTVSLGTVTSFAANTEIVHGIINQSW
jgi:hypothetical protein